MSGYPVTSRELTRRSVVRRSLATASLGGVLATAGCSDVTDQSGGDDNTTPDEDEESEPAPERVYADWLPAPAELDDRDHYSFTHVTVSDYESNEDRIDTESYDPSGLEDSWRPLTFDAEDTSRFTTIGTSLVVEADFSRTDAVSTLEDEGFEEDSEHNGYTLVVEEGDGQVFAVGDGTLVIADETGIAETILDTEAGDAERYDEASDDMATLIAELGAGSFVTGGTRDEPDRPDPETGQFQNMVANGNATTINGDTFGGKVVVVYESADDVDTDDLETWVRANDGPEQRFDGIEDVTYSNEGRKGIITGSGETSDI